MKTAPLPELEELERIVALAGPEVHCEVACEVRDRGRVLPVYAITLGNADPALPAVGYFGGVHGLERIGARVVIAFLHNLVMRLGWDASLRQMLERHESIAGFRVVEHRMAMAEGAALDVLAGEPDRYAVGEDGGERELLSRRPVDRSLVRRVEHAPAVHVNDLGVTTATVKSRTCLQRVFQLGRR